jgi:hypothetical protein
MPAVTAVSSLVERPEVIPAQLLFEEARRRRRRRRHCIITVAILLTGGALAVTVTMGSGDHPSSPTTSSTSISRFIPPTSTKGGLTTMEVRLPDGRGFNLTFPRSLNLSKFSLTASGQVNWPRSTGPLNCCNEAMAPYYGSLASIFSGKPIAVYRGAHGQAVPYYAGTQERYPFLYSNMDYLAFQFGPWIVLVEDIAHSSYFTARMTGEERATWARSFDDRVTTSGYLVFQPHSPLYVVRAEIDVVLKHDDDSLEISGLRACGASESPPTDNAGVTAWCDTHADVGTCQQM